ncbi:cytochrome P450 [Xylariales sp. AK1849]|nr:cytochrome P450 [Xylariales sp. AK1849]
MDESSPEIPRRAFSLVVVLIAAIIALLFLRAVQFYVRLRYIPGPKAAALTNFVRRLWVASGSIHQKHTDLHRKYGTVVRVGPNAVLISQPAAIEKIYGFKARFAKSEFYDSIIPRMKGGKIPDVFATRDESLHRRMRRPIANLYSVANLTNFEPLVISTIQYFFERLDELYTDMPKDCHISEWLQLFTFDVMGKVTFSRRLGFLERGGDVDGVIENNWKFFKTVAVNTQMPWLDYFWKDNPLIPKSAKKNPLAEFGAAPINERLSLAEKGGEAINQRDFLSCFIKEVEKDHALPDMALPTWTNSNIQAGGDTTSILATVTIYYLLKNPASLTKLIQEIESAAKEGRISKIVTWKEAQSLTYLDACVKEASRLHPPIGFPIERIVPETGLEVDGYIIPSGTRVAMNPWAVHRETGLYGQDPDVWRPERWLCGEEKKRSMYNSLLTFGAGHRGCLGKNLSYIEIYKIIPSLLHRYDLKLTSPKEDWSIETKWFSTPSGCTENIEALDKILRACSTCSIPILIRCIVQTRENMVH